MEGDTYLYGASWEFRSWISSSRGKEVSDVDEWQGADVEEIPDGLQRIGDPSQSSQEGVDGVVDEVHDYLEIWIHGGWWK